MAAAAMLSSFQQWLPWAPGCHAFVFPPPPPFPAAASQLPCWFCHHPDLILLVGARAQSLVSSFFLPLLRLLVISFCLGNKCHHPTSEFRCGPEP
jgi:hypothetical protein